MNNKGLWIVYENINTEVEVFDSYEKAIKYYEERKEEIVNDGSSYGLDSDEKIYLSKVERQAFWKQDENQPIYKTDEYGYETEEESGDYYWRLEEERDSDE